MKFPIQIFSILIFSLTGKAQTSVAHPITKNAITPIDTQKMGIIYRSKPVRVYPNPVSEFLDIRFGPIQDEFLIYNSMGEIVSEEKSPNRHIDVSKFQPGIYFLKIRSGSEIFTSKFVKE